MIVWLNQTLFVVGTDHVTPAEILGFATGLWCVYLIVKERALNWPVGIANSIFFFILFFNAKLYADGYLQIVYVVLGFAGWYSWSSWWRRWRRRRGIRSRDREGLPVSLASRYELVIAGVFAGLATGVMYPLLKHMHDIAPFWDALTTGLSLSAQGLLILKRFENWYFWIAADLIYIPLYFAKNLYLTGIVYVAFLSLCCAGVHQWQQSRKAVTA